MSGAGRAPTRDQRVLHRRRGLRRLRPARPPPHPGDRAEPRRPGAVHAAPRPDEPGHPGHLLRPPPAGRRAVDRRRCSPRCASAYADEPFVVVIDGSPSTKATLGSNAAHVTARYDERTGFVIALCALDNLTKGASGGALQAANVALGLDETAGLPRSAWRRDAVREPAATSAIDRRAVARPSAHVLVEALPYIRRFAGKTVVVKYGGNALAGTSDHDALDAVRRGHRADAPRRHAPGRRPRRRPADQRADAAPRQDDASSATACGSPTPRPSTSPGWCCIGQVNPQLVTAINLHGNYAVGVSGEDAGLIQAAARDPELGFVGDVDAINPGILDGPPGRRVHPGRRHDRHRRARARRTTSTPTSSPAPSPRRSDAEKLVYLTDIEGLRRDVDDPASLIRQTTADELDALDRPTARSPAG